MTLAKDFEEHIRAGFSGLWVRSYEFSDALADLIKVCNARNWELGWWDVANGLQGMSRLMSLPDVANNKRYPKPMLLFQTWSELAEQLARHPKPAAKSILVICNYQLKDLAENNGYTQALQNMIQAGKSGDSVSSDGKEFEYTWHVVFLSPIVNVPVEIARQVVVLEHELPTRDQLLKIATAIEPTAVPTTPMEQSLLTESAAGLTRYEAEGAFSLSLIRTGTYNPKVVWQQKAQALKKRGLLTLYEGDDSFENLGGLEHFKDFTLRLLKKKTDNPLLFPKGLLLLGCPGAGKSAAVKCLGNDTNRRVLELNIGALRGKYQGETEHNIIDALAIADAMQPAIIFVDEVEKALSGAGGSGDSDGGVGSRLFGTLLAWLNDHRTDVFFVGTCNKIASLPPEFSRAERFDGIFFFDLPTASERRAIWKIYLKLYGVKPLPEDEMLALSNDWTGAEIKSCCRLSAVLDISLKESADNVVPIVKTCQHELEALRDWASGRCLSTSKAGKYTKGYDELQDAPKTTKRRNVSRN